MPYTWEEVMLGVDSWNESVQKSKHKKTVGEMQVEEDEKAGLYSLGLSVLGAFLLGPAGYYAGKQAGEWIADWQYDWESMEMDEGIFDVSAAKDYNKAMDKVAKDQTQGQVLNAVLDIGKAYVSSGGLTAEKGEWDPTTWGSGDAEWNILGRGDPGTPTTFGTPYIDPLNPTGNPLTPVTPGTPPSANYVPSLWEEGIGRLESFYKGDKAMTKLDQFALSLLNK
tara:strand:+ start:43 stop:714 length:672 start_codon:yes stop_codon:yes gene_type:complete